MSGGMEGPQIASMSILDRGDAPAQAIIDKTTRAKAKRVADETKEELDKIRNRVAKTIDAFEMNEQYVNDNKSAILVPDLIELEKIISDAIAKKKYQQEVVIFIVGYENNCAQRAKLLSSLNEFFVTSMNTYDEDELMPRHEIDLEEVSTSIQTALDTAENATQKLSEINHEMVTYIQTVTGGKAATKSKKKLEKALQQAKDDIQSLTEKLLGAQTEIEDKEDQMTRLYKQIDLKNMDIQKQKAQTEAARDKLKQVEELKLVIRARDDEIDGYNKKIADLQLHIQQIEQSREASQAKLRSSNEDNENAIEKLNIKLMQTQVALEDLKIDLKKEHDTAVKDIRKQHKKETEQLKNEYEEKIKKLENTIQAYMEEELERVKRWESDSEDEAERTYSRRSTNLDGTTSLSRKSSRVSKDKPGSRQKKDQQSRQNSEDSLKTATPKPVSRTKTNLETVEEVPFDESIPLEDEQRWANLPPQKLRSGFKQYRNESLLLITSLQSEVKTHKEESTKKYNKIKGQFRDTQHKWEAERQVLTEQVEQAQRLQTEAEKEADDSMLQLEVFVNEHDKLNKALEEEKEKTKQVTEELESKKERKKLTPEQREMLKLDKSTAKTPETTKEQVEDETQTTPLPVTDHSQQTSRTEMYRDLSQLLPTADTMSSQDPPKSRQTTTTVDTGKATGAPSEMMSEMSRPESPNDQKEMLNKLKAQMEERRAERQSRATSMHGSLLSAKSRTETATTDDVPFPEVDEEGDDAGVDVIDATTSPMTIGSATSRKSVSIAEHPVVQEYLKTYQSVINFKEELVKLLQEKELMSHVEQLNDIPIVEFDTDRLVHVQAAEMQENTDKFLREISNILSSLINNDMDPRVSSLMSRGLTSQTFTTQQSQPTVTETIQQPSVREVSNLTDESEAMIKELKDAYDKLRDEKDSDKKVYEEQLNHNAVVMMEMQDMVTDLQRELAAAGSAARYGSTAQSREQDPAIMFSSLDLDRNQRMLKKGLHTNKVTPETYNKAVDAMEKYTDLPSKRLVHLVKKYTHHVQMKAIEETVRESQSLDDDVFQLLDKMESLQNARAQRWNERMDDMGEERMRLAQILMDTLTMIEEESGIFLIKPIYSWKGKGYIAKYTGKISNNYRPTKIVSRALTPLREGTPMNMVPAPTPASLHTSKVMTRPSTQGAGDGPDDEEVPMQGSSVNVGPDTQPMWSMSVSQTKPPSVDGTTKLPSSMITTPRLLELDVNRMLIGQNTISASIRPVQSDDRLVMASNTNLRSYMTIARPSANPSPNMRVKRPHSTPGTMPDMQTAAPPSTPFVNQNSSGSGSRLRAKSAEAFNVAQPLPPIKVPSSEDGLANAPPNTKSSAGSTKSLKSVAITTPRDSPIQQRPSPPNTPPGSSLRPSVSPGTTPLPPETPVGHVTKIIARSPSQSTVHSLPPVEAES
ncbi:uncharacterized protein LOC144450307 isoform X2 [Glandiceps talaboti]